MEPTVANKAPIPDKACLALAIYSLSELASALPAIPATAALATPRTTFLMEPKLSNKSPFNKLPKLKLLRPKNSSLPTPASAKKSLFSSPSGLFLSGESTNAAIVVLLCSTISIKRSLYSEKSPGIGIPLSTQILAHLPTAYVKQIANGILTFGLGNTEVNNALTTLPPRPPRKPIIAPAVAV